MARFDVYIYDKKRDLLLLDVQADILRDLETRVVVPLYSEKLAGAERVERLRPVLKINGKDYVMITTEIAAQPVSMLGTYVENVENRYRQTVTEALDFLFHGF